MDEQLHKENNSYLAKISSFITFPYIWLGLFMILNTMYGSNFFGVGLAGDLVALLLCLGLLNPGVPGAIAQLVAYPLFLNLLGKKLVSNSGCLVGLGGFFLTVLSVLYYLTRDQTMATWLFVMAPVVGCIVAALVSLSSWDGLQNAIGNKKQTDPLPGKARRLPPPSGSSRLSSSRRNNSTKKAKRPPTR